MNIGTRVKVNITKHETYAHGVCESLNHRTGVVESDKGLILVRFDQPAPPWFSYQLPVKAFHFHRSELIELEDDVDALCNVCMVEHHDTCAGNPNCPCCCDAMEKR